MNIKYVVAIVYSDNLERLHAALNSIRIGGVTLTKVKGYGEYKNLYTEDWLVEHTKVEVFAEESKADLLVKVLLDMSRSEPPGAGIVAVMPVERFFHLRTGTETLPGGVPAI